jgi:competence protein ComEC
MSERGTRSVRVALSVLAVVTIAVVGLWVGEEPTAAVGLFQVTFINVGQGDSAWLQTPDGLDILIDGGKPGQGPALVSFLQDHGVLDIEVLVLTHPDDDHVGGLVDVLEEIEVDEALTNCQEGSAASYWEFKTLLQEGSIPEYCVRDGDSFAWGAYVSAVAVHPVDPLMSGTNNNSVVLRVTCGSVDFLFAGDIEEEAEAAILGRGATLEAEILKVPHHGSNGSSTVGFISTVGPQEAVISVGTNPYGHPGVEALQRLWTSGATIWRTDKNGNVLVETDGTEYWVMPEWYPYVYLPLGMTPLPGGVAVNGECSDFDAPGVEEYVCFTNWGPTYENMTGWRVQDDVAHTYTFPTFGLGPGATVRLHTGSGTNSATDLYWGRGAAVWNNGGDTVYLYDEAWNLVDSYSYP